MKLVAALVLIVAAGCTNSSDSSDPQPSDQVTVTTSEVSEVPSDDVAAAEATTTEVRQAELALVTVAQANLPLAMAWRPGDDNAYIADKQGILLTLLPDGQVDEVWDFSDQVSSNGEQGFLGLVFSPDGEWLYLSYTNPSGDSHLSVVPFGETGPDFAAEQVLLVVDQPFENHNGGDLQFGLDGYLYWGLGDGGSGGDPQGNGQNPNSLLGSMVRIRPLPESGTYDIPPDNPFADGGGAPEVWLTGLRNPWRFSFDTQNGDMWIGDVGQEQLEEIDRVKPSEAGANLGWADCEGTLSYNADCDGFHDPIYTYGRDDGIAVTGGYVYRGNALPQLAGQYIFADFVTARIWAFNPDTSERIDTGLQSANVASFAQDPSGELWVLSLNGTIQQIVDISS
jgi:glucose/arabinose dehydrogenase